MEAGMWAAPARRMLDPVGCIRVAGAAWSFVASDVMATHATSTHRSERDGRAHRRLVLIIVFAAGCSGGPASAPPLSAAAASFQGIGDLPGGLVRSEALAISD